MRYLAAFTLMVAVLLGGGCAHYPVNPPLARYDPDAGYRFKSLAHDGNSDSLQIFMAFSGGGTRAAALSYGVLEELARTEVVWEGQRRRLLDEVDYISAVSGGSFTAAYYALNGDDTFTSFEKKVLERDIQSALVWRLFSPVNWVRLASPYFSRSDLAAEYYDNHIFNRATYGDLLKRNRRPFLSINATDMSAGSTFQFTQEQFDYLCANISDFSLGRAVAASAAYPILLSPVTINNYGCGCGFVEPAWMGATNQNGRMRATMRARELKSYQDAVANPYVHLLDGGLSDNLGLRGPYEDIAFKGGFRNKVGADLDPRSVSKMVIIVVNASFRRSRGWSRQKQTPNIMQVTLALGSVPTSRYSFDTLQLLRDSVREWEWEWNSRNAAELSEAGALASPPKPIKIYTVEVGFDDLQNETERRYFESLPTALKLSPEAVARLRAVAGKLLTQSESYQALLQDLGNESQE